ncbi:protein translocase subunit SecF [Caulobacter sp. ErkDOM-E]|uniref:protein translocase subunit SecF n=1 Tax=Caulobacter sp. ErkDOM-E TaxID=3402778 RepID=UPI003AF5AD80
MSAPMAWPLIKLLPQKTNLTFVKFARLMALISATLVVASMVGVFMPGLNMGIDFKGGSVMEVSTAPRAVDLAKVRTTLEAQGLGDVQVQEFGAADRALVRFQTPAGGDAGVTLTNVKTALKQSLGEPVQFINPSAVGPKVSGELFRSGIIALVLAVGLMFLYIWFRFEPQFGLGAVAGLLHDLILTFGFIVLFKIEFSLNTVAALLTVIGYSMNDTVVVFDRLRENLRKYKKMPLAEVIDLSINETLSRTIITGVTAVMALAGLAIFGGEALFGFSVVMIFGIIVGTYSSIYVGAPIILLWGVKRGDDDATPITFGAASRP